MGAQVLLDEEDRLPALPTPVQHLVLELWRSEAGLVVAVLQLVAAADVGAEGGIKARKGTQAALERRVVAGGVAEPAATGLVAQVRVAKVVQAEVLLKVFLNCEGVRLEMGAKVLLCVEHGLIALAALVKHTLLEDEGAALHLVIFELELVAGEDVVAQGAVEAGERAEGALQG